VTSPGQAALDAFNRSAAQWQKERAAQDEAARQLLEKLFGALGPRAAMDDEAYARTLPLFRAAIETGRRLPNLGQGPDGRDDRIHYFARLSDGRLLVTSRAVVLARGGEKLRVCGLGAAAARATSAHRLRLALEGQQVSVAIDDARTAAAYIARAKAARRTR